MSHLIWINNVCKLNYCHCWHLYVQLFFAGLGGGGGVRGGEGVIFSETENSLI